MNRLARIICEPGGSFVFYSGDNLVTQGRSPQHRALAQNIIQNSERVEAVEDGPKKILTVKGQRNG